MRPSTILLLALSIITAIWIVTYLQERSAECEQQGKILARTAWGYTCVAK